MIRRNVHLLVVVLLLASCGGGATATSAPAPTGGETETTSPVAQEPVTVQIKADEYSFESDLTTFKVGIPYHFIVTNTGAKEHEFMIVAPIEPGVMDMEAMDALAVAHVEEDDLQEGDVVSVDYTFTTDDIGQLLEFACHLDTHYEDGMHETITVTG